MKTNAGFSMVEVLVAITVSMIIMVGVYSAFLSQQKSTVVQTNVSDIQQNLRAAMDFLARDIRMAGYAGTEYGSSDNFGFDDVGFSDFSGSPNAGSKDQGFLQFTWDTDDNSTLDATDRITYSLMQGSDVASDSISLMREVGSAGRQAMAGYIIALGLAYAYDSDNDGELETNGENGPVIWAVDFRNDGIWDNLDTNGDGLINTDDTAGGTSTGTPVKTQDIRAVRIWLLGRSKVPDNTYTDNNVYVVGPQVYRPNNNYRHRLLERTVLCRNMGFKL